MPVIGATLSFFGGGVTTTSDAQGYFTLTGVPASTLESIYDHFDRIELRNDVEPSPDGESPARVEFVHDQLGRLTQLLRIDRGDVSASYEPNGQLRERLFANGVTSSFTYEPSGRLARLTHALNGFDDLGEPFITEILDATYGYDVSGDLTSIDEGPGALRNFAYDDLKRLTAAGTALEPESYAYDPQGNRTASHLSNVHITGPANRLLEDEQFTYAYDANGNLASKTEKLSGLTTEFTWDAQDQMVRIDFPDDTYAAYRYDALGRRIEKDVNGTAATRYVYDGRDIVLEFDASDGTNRHTATYDHGEGVDQPMMLHRAVAIDPDDGVGTAYETYYYHADDQGSIRKITDYSGAVVNSYDYDAYGNILSAVEGVPQPFAYTGREYDAESGLYYYRARYYDPQTGRFVNQDPMGFAAGDANLYRYVRNDPTNLIDPFGLTATTYDQTAAIGVRTAPSLAALGARVRKLFQYVNLALRLADGAGGGGSPPEDDDHDDDDDGGGDGGDDGNGGDDSGGGDGDGGGDTGGNDVSQGNDDVPQKARDVLDHVESTGDAPDGYKGGKTFQNDGRNGGEVLPKADKDGNAIDYREYDVNSYEEGVNRGTERVVRGSDGSAYYTDDHYDTFTRIK